MSLSLPMGYLTTLVGYSYRVVRTATVVTFALAALSGLLGIATTVLVGRAVGAVPEVIAGGSSVPGYVALVGALLVVFVATSVLPAFQQLTFTVMVNDVRREITVGVTEPLLRPVGVAHLEDSVIQDQANRARGRTWAGFQLRVGLESLPELVRSRLVLLGSAALVGLMFSWWVAAGLAAVTFLMEWHRGQVLEKELDSVFGNTESQRKAEYAFELGMKEAPKELRIFDLGGWLVQRFRTHTEQTWIPIWRARRRGLVATVPVTAAHLGAHALAIFLVGRSALAGELALTQVATVVPAILAVGMSYNGEAVVHAKRGVAAYDAMHTLPAVIAERHPVPPASTDLGSTDSLPRQVIRFEDVGFRYPGNDINVLAGLNLELRAGEALALVGVNGAGKSTLVKLLAGVYEPTSGRITVDGIDLRELDIRTWQRRVATIVQDFARFPFSAEENVVLGAADSVTDGRGIRAVAERAGVSRVIEKLPNGWETILDQTFDGGVDLSGGEWQRVALARALVAVDTGASVLVLDEPAAALDVRAEAELVERYLDLTAGVTSLIISHRFSVVRDAHRICVLDGGRIVESGTHEELLTAGGRYAKLFRLQAERYLPGVSDD